MKPICPRCGCDLSKQEILCESQKSGAPLCLHCFKEECIALKRELLLIPIPLEMLGQIYMVVKEPCLGFDNTQEFVMESLRKNIRFYLDARGRGP